MAMEVVPMTPPSTMRRALVVAGAAVIALATFFGVYRANGVNPFAPASMLIALPVMFLAEPLRNETISLVLIPIVPAVLYCASSRWLLREVHEVPIGLWFLHAILVLGSLTWFGLSWSYGVKYQGLQYTLICAISNGVMAAATMVFGLSGQRSGAYLPFYLFHTLLFSWLGWLSFPWLGEMP